MEEQNGEVARRATEEEYLKFAHLRRGLFLNAFASLEKTIEVFLVRYFALENKKGEFINIILDRMTFYSKMQSLDIILQNKAVKGGFLKTNSNSYPDSRLLKSLRELNDKRNRFAHDLVAIPEEGDNENMFGLAQFRDKTQVHWYTKEDYNKLIESTNLLEKEVEELMGG
jgi:hypothetical protein